MNQDMNQRLNEQLDERIKVLRELKRLLRQLTDRDDDNTLGVGVRRKSPPLGPKPSKAAAELDTPQSGKTK